MRHFAFAVVLLFAFACFAQERRRPDGVSPEQQQPSAADRGEQAQRPAPPEKEPPEEKPVVTHQEARVGGKVVRYTATTGMMPIKNEQTGKVEAHMFYVAYTLDNPAPGRPLTVAFNGGPGSASVWLHMGAIGPKRVKMLPEGGMPAPPFTLEDNEASWLDQTDLVFVDPVGTGYSRALTPELGRKFWGLEGDIASVGEFIRMYLVRYQRWTSPLFLAGESYGTTRAAGLSGYLIDRGIPLNGIVLISSVLNFQTLSFSRGNDLPYVLYLPTFTMTAYYHKKLPAEVQQMDQAKLLSEVSEWAENGYLQALQKGDRLSQQDRGEVIQKLVRYTGLPERVIDQNDLRIDQPHFNRELLRDQHLIVGRLDSRFTGSELSGGERPDFDPSEAAIRPPYTTVFNEYVRNTLGYKTDAVYYILGGGIGSWDFGLSQRGGFPETAEALHRAFAKNPYMKVLVAEGWYDEATPLLAVEYTLAHMGLMPQARKNISTEQYPAGHMVYIQMQSLAKLKQDVSSFMQQALSEKGGKDLGR